MILCNLIFLKEKKIVTWFSILNSMVAQLIILVGDMKKKVKVHFWSVAQPKIQILKVFYYWKLMNQSGPHVFLKARRNFALAVQTNRLQRSFVCFLTRKRSVKSPFHELESHLWKSANLEKLVQNLKEEKGPFW